MNVNDSGRKGLLGFAIRKTAPNKQPDWLSGMLPFPKMAHTPGQPIKTNVAPIQKFRWSDYGVEPGRQYRYEVFPVYGTPDQLKINKASKVTVTVNTAVTDLNTLINHRGSHAVVF